MFRYARTTLLLGVPLLLCAALVSPRAVSSDEPAKKPVMGSTAISWEEIEAKPKKGRAWQIFQDPTATLDELELHVTTLEVGGTPHPAHKHPDEEIVIIKTGTVEAMVNGQAKRLGPGSIIFQAANQMHSLRNVGDVPAVYHVIKWNSPGMLKARTGN
jgi:XRE family transcriptional regulator, regulator of sulfur utilization